MDREIKFRGWDKETKTMLYFDLEDVPSHSFAGVGFKLHKNNPVMQFTGLYDSKGKEIYEGDILNFADDGIKYTVRWDNEYAEFNCGNEFDKPLVKSNQEELEVIGNIYQDAKLLQKEQGEE